FRQHGKYNSWADFRNAALAGWKQCQPLIRPRIFTWLSIRYINNIEIASPNNEKVLAESLFKTFIANEGKNKNQAIAAYALRYTHFHEAENVMVHFGQELLQGQLGTLPFIVDIDVIHNKSYEPTEINIQEKFEMLRDIKNDYFFDNLTQSTLELLK
ncbi:MAG: TIGR04255 family protein, partial [Flammeovirgaceae bacterium]